MTLQTSILRRTFAGLVAIALFAAGGSGPKSEPQHHGAPLSFWWEESDKGPEECAPETVPALLALHRDALPELGRRLVARETTGHRLLKHLQRLSPGLPSSGSDLETRRLRAAQLAALLGEQASSRTPELIQAFRMTRRSETREVLGQRWMRMGNNGIPALGVLAQDPNPAVRAEALHWLGTLLSACHCPESMRTDLAILVTCQLSASEIPVVLAAVRALSELADDGSPAVPMLLRHLTHATSAVRAAAAKALGRIANRDVTCVGPLIRLLTDPVDDVRSASAIALAQFGPLAGPAVPQLVETWNIGPTAVALPAIHALGRIGPGSATAVPDLALVLGARDGSSVMRSSVAAALGRIAQRPALAVPALMAATRDPDSGIRESAIRALAAFGPDAEPAVPALIAALAEGSEPDRILAAEALGSIGPGARSAVPFLEAARNNNQSVMSGPVLSAVARIVRSGSVQPGAVYGESSP
jgi:HEAT repeat protein